MMVILILILSVCLNVFLIWYGRRLLINLFFVSDNLEELLGSIQDFSGHLESIHELQTYYGDETLQGLIRHSRQVVEEIKGYSNIHLDREEEVEDAEEEVE